MFELLCYAAMTIAILVLRHEQDTFAHGQTPVIVEVQPVEAIPFAHGTQIDELPVGLPVTVVELVKPVTYKRPAAKSSYLAACTIPVDSIAPTLPQGWDLDRNGNPLRGAALKGRKRKLGIE